jgi:protein HIRA/HIR1
VIVWRVLDWTIVAKVHEPYHLLKQPSQAHRLSWSPDGQSLLTSNGFLDVRPVAPVLARGSWEVVANLVGHSRAVGACRFSPRLLRTSGDVLDAGNRQQTCCAIGGNDGAVTVWTQFHNGQAVLALPDLFEFPVSDIAW